MCVRSVTVGGVQNAPPVPALLAGRQGGSLGMGDLCAVAVATGRARNIHLSDIVATSLRSKTSGATVSPVHVCTCGVGVCIYVCKATGGGAGSSVCVCVWSKFAGLACTTLRCCGTARSGGLAAVGAGPGGTGTAVKKPHSGTVCHDMQHGIGTRWCTICSRMMCPYHAHVASMSYRTCIRNGGAALLCSGAASSGRAPAAGGSRTAVGTVTRKLRTDESDVATIASGKRAREASEVRAQGADDGKRQRTEATAAIVISDDEGDDGSSQESAQVNVAAPGAAGGCGIGPQVPVHEDAEGAVHAVADAQSGQALQQADDDPSAGAVAEGVPGQAQDEAMEDEDGGKRSARV